MGHKHVIQYYELFIQGSNVNPKFGICYCFVVSNFSFSVNDPSNAPKILTRQLWSFHLSVTRIDNLSD